MCQALFYALYLAIYLIFTKVFEVSTASVTITTGEN